MGLLDESSLEIPAFKRLPEAERESARRAARARPYRWRLALLVLCAAGVGVGAALLARNDAPQGEVPLITAEPGPVRTRPEDPGGTRIANQDRMVYERSIERGVPAASRMMPPPEAPLPPPSMPVEAQAAVAPSAIAPALAGPNQTAPNQVAPNPTGSALASAARTGSTLSAQASAIAPRGGAPTPAAAQGAGPPPTSAAPVVQAGLPASRPGQAVAASVQVQLAALYSEADARGEWQRMARRWPDLLGSRGPIVSATQRDGRTLYRLRTAGFADAEAAQEFCAQLRTRGGQCVLARF